MLGHPSVITPFKQFTRTHLDRQRRTGRCTQKPVFFIRILEISPQNVPILEQNPAKTGKFHPNFPILRSSLEEDISKAIGPIFKIFDFY